MARKLHNLIAKIAAAKAVDLAARNVNNLCYKLGKFRRAQ